MTDAVRETQWDVIVIGTGMGGGLAGRRLAEAGMRVLFVEKGPAGPRGERVRLDPGVFEPAARLARGFWPAPMEATLDGRRAEFFAPVGAGLGGSSVFYAATLERPERHDLEDADGRPHPTGGWPVGYDTFRPWFEEAERWLAICGEPDPLSPELQGALRAPPPPDPGDAALMAAFRAAGLHPYRSHSAIAHVEGCLGCLGSKCPKRCKMDGRSAGVEPALATGRAALLDRCEVTALQGGQDRISHLSVRRDGESFTLSAPRIVLAAGALGSPRLLLASASDAWPEGCANESGLVGRNLMFHLNEMMALWPGRAARFEGPSKAISLRDLYHVGGDRFGTVQAMGMDVGYGEIVHFLRGMMERSALRRLKPFAPLPAAAAERVFGQAKVFVGLLEDLPYPENRVLPPEGDDRIRVAYRYAPELLERRRRFRRAMKRAFRAHRTWFLNPGPELNFGHPSGTLAFGEDPRRSVLRPDCRAHGVRNLWVADASFMPTSMGVNPSLTIAANALRVADAIAEDTR